MLLFFADLNLAGPGDWRRLRGTDVGFRDRFGRQAPREPQGQQRRERPGTE